MNPYSFDINSANELRLRRHIREVLLPYARIHLTSDHVAFTEKVVEELLLQNLEYVPMADATSFFLPVEPFEHLSHLLDSLDLSPPEEKWVTSSEHVRYLRTFFPPFDPQDLRSEKCWYEEDHHMNVSLMFRPLSSPILSERAKRETPRLGCTNYGELIPRSNSALTAFLGPRTVSVSSIEDLPTLPVDDVLDLRYKLDHATNTHTRLFLQSVLLPSTKKFVSSFEDTANVPEFLGHESPPRCLPGLDSPPLFPRVAQVPTHTVRDDTNNGISNPARFLDLASMVQKASPELIYGEDGDINGYHMEVISGRSTLTFSSPPPCSLRSSIGDEIDELWDISPLGTPATSLMAAKMDEVEIPRIRKYGHKNTPIDERAHFSNTVDLLTGVKSPGFFITSFISAPIPMAQAHTPITSQLGDVIKPGMHSPRPLSHGQDTSGSLLGQPPSISEERSGEKAPADFANPVEDLGAQEFDDVVASIYISTPQDPLSYIIEEKLDDKDMLMDVPNLPPPTAHPREPILFPEGMQTFVRIIREAGRLDAPSHGSNPLGLASFLRPVKGIKPLALDLSWRPFNFGKTIPTDEDVAGIAKSIQPVDELLEYHDEKYEERVRTLFNLCIAPTSAEGAQTALIPNLPRGCEEFGMSPAPQREEGNDHIGFLLTRRERLRASSSKMQVQTRDESDAGQHCPLRSYNGGHDIPTRDKGLLQHEYQGPPNVVDPVESQTRGHSYPSNDSRANVDNIVCKFPTSESSTTRFVGPFQNNLPHDRNTPLESVDDGRGENKENIPPWDVSDYQPTGYQPDSLAKPYDWSCYFDFPESQTPPFEPLSFASQTQSLGPSDGFAHSKAQDVPPATPSGCHPKRAEHELVSTGEQEQTNPRATKRRKLNKLNDLVPASSKDLFYTFIGLCNKATPSMVQPLETRNDSPTPNQTLHVPEQTAPRAAPDDLFDQHTVRLPGQWIPAAAAHRYLVSMNVIQKRALVRELQGHHCRVVLVERYDLGGTDVIIDLDYSVLIMPLLALPSNIESAMERISGESWHYSNLLVIFEAFPCIQSYRADHSQVNRPVPYAYTSPICKAVKKLRRNLGIAEGCGTMNPRCVVTWAFANNVGEIARFVRCFGEEACATSMERDYGMQWDDREWLEEQEREGESLLASLHGMNAFAAFVMLYNQPLETILDSSSEARLAEFGPLLGRERVTGLNALIESRLQPIARDSAYSDVDPEY